LRRAFLERTFRFDPRARKNKRRKLARKATMLTLKVQDAFKSQPPPRQSSDGMSPPTPWTEPARGKGSLLKEPSA
jgi:hypothetical protein